MKEITFNIHYCCDDQFKKLYGKFIRSLKKQYGKKGLAELSIIAEESKLPDTLAVYQTFSYFDNIKNCCSKCSKVLNGRIIRKNYYYNEDHKKITTLKEMKIKVTKSGECI